MQYTAAFTVTEPEAAVAALSDVAATHGGWAQHVTGNTVHVYFQADSNYTARTHALVMADTLGDVVTGARVRTGARMFTGPWFDLHEEAMMPA